MSPKIAIKNSKKEVNFMKVLSLMEPWGSLIKEKIKYIETRSWKTNYRGELYIHTSLKKIPKKDERIQNLVNLLQDNDIKYGYIIAKCNLVDCIYMDETFVNKIKNEKPIEYMCGEYAVGRYAWILEDIEMIKPMEAKGHLGLWEYPKI